MKWSPITLGDKPLPYPRSGIAAVDTYLDAGFEAVPGWTSRLSAAVMAGLMDIQAGLGIRGHFIEIGVFEGRLFVVAARALGAQEKAVGIDPFDWPQPDVGDRFRAHLAQQNIDPRKVVIVTADSRKLAAADLSRHFGDLPCRFVHVDGDHAAESALSDIELSDGILCAEGLMVIDDLLHPCYPHLTVAVHGFLSRRKDWRLLCVIDRTSVVGAAKYVLCRMPAWEMYQAALSVRYKRHVWPMDVPMDGYVSLLISCDQSYLPSMMYQGAPTQRPRRAR
jgi:hypothetical protein